MGMIERYSAYAEAFEQAYASDNWSVLEPYFTQDVGCVPGSDDHKRQRRGGWGGDEYLDGGDGLS